MSNPDQPNLARALLALQKDHATGVLEVRVEGMKTLVYLSEGKPSHVDEGTLDETLGRLLIRTRKLTYAQYKRVIDQMSQAMSRGKQLRFGEAVEALGLMSEADVTQALGDQTRWKVVRCLQWDKPQWDFDPSPARLRKMPCFPLAVEPMILEAAKLLSPQHRSDVLGAVAGRHPLVRNVADLVVRFRMTPVEGGLVSSLDGTVSFDEAAERSEKGALLAALVLSDEVILLGTALARPKAAPPKSVRPTKVGASVRAPAPDVRRKAVSVVGRLQKGRPLAVKPEEVSTKAPANVHEARLLAEQAFQGGKAMLRGNTLDAAAPLFRRAVELYSDAPEYALYAQWVDFRLSRDAAPPAGKDLLILAKKTVTRDPNFAFGHYVLAHLARLNGDTARADSLLAHASRLDPELVENERHVRIVRSIPAPRLAAVAAVADAVIHVPPVGLADLVLPDLGAPTLALPDFRLAELTTPAPDTEPDVLPASTLPGLGLASLAAPTSDTLMSPPSSGSLPAAKARTASLSEVLIAQVLEEQAKKGEPAPLEGTAPDQPLDIGYGPKKQSVKVPMAPAAKRRLTAILTGVLIALITSVTVAWGVDDNVTTVTASGMPAVAAAPAKPASNNASLMMRPVNLAVAPSAAPRESADRTATPSSLAADASLSAAQVIDASAAPSSHAETPSAASAVAGGTPAGPTPSAPAAPLSKSGDVTFPANAAGHRVFLDGRVLGHNAGPFHVPCGPHSVRVGSGGKPVAVNVPCGGEVKVSD